MNKSSLLSAVAVCLLASSLMAQTTQPQVKIPADGDNNGANAQAALKASPRHGEWVDVAMPGSDTKIKSFVVYPERKDKAPVVIVIFEIFGMSDWIGGVTDQLAAEGFIAIAPDLLSGYGPNGGGTESLGNNVGQTIRLLTPEEQAKRLDAVRDYAIKLPAATDKVGCIGFCWGGGASFNYAARQPKLNAAVVYYGTPPDKALMEKITCPVLGCYGGNDARVTATVEPTKATMAELKKSYEPHIYEGAGHGFLRQHTGATGEANLKASQQAWPTTIAFFKKNLE
jgi:carboxymethylenebutenolidase